jgi:hypothetical protein
MTDRLSCDMPKHTRDEATELCVYHLRMAASLFQLVPDDENKSLLSEIDRQCDDILPAVDIAPAKLWAAAMLAAYEDMKDTDE